MKKLAVGENGWPAAVAEFVGADLETRVVLADRVGAYEDCVDAGSHFVYAVEVLVVGE